MGIEIQPNNYFNLLQSQLDPGFGGQTPKTGSNNSSQFQPQTSYWNQTTPLAGILQSVFTMFGILMNLAMRLVAGQSQSKNPVCQCPGESPGSWTSPDNIGWGAVKSFGSKLLGKASDYLLGSDSGSGIFGWIKNLF